jgi:hypothetical protein
VGPFEVTFGPNDLAFERRVLEVPLTVQSAREMWR